MHAVLNLIISRDKKLIGPINVTFTDAHVMKSNIFYLSSYLHVSKGQSYMPTYVMCIGNMPALLSVVGITEIFNYLDTHYI